MTPNDKAGAISNSLKCKGCGAVLYYEPGTKQLKCGHCGATNEITSTETSQDIECYDYDKFVEELESAPVNTELQQVKCNNCGSQTVLPKNVTADKCPFCSSPLIIQLDNSQGYVRPHYVLPFGVNQATATENFKNWMKGLSFAPSDLAQKVNNSSKPALDGVYLPYWSFDADAETNYEGSRGEHYYTTETYTEVVDGEERTNTREVMHTNWWPVTGTVENTFEDIVIPASSSLPPDTLEKVGGWNFNTLTEYDERYISGFRSETYQVKPQDGLEGAKNAMASEINRTILNDIGGDEQRIIDSSTQLSDIGIKYLLLPVWVTSYVYNSKVYQVTINASTGEVHGHRPYSAMKIILLVIAIIIAIVLIAYFASNK